MRANKNMPVSRYQLVHTLTHTEKINSDFVHGDSNPLSSSVKLLNGAYQWPCNNRNAVFT